MGRLGIAAFLVVASAVGGCSPYAYNDEISNFSTGVDTIAASYDAGQQGFANSVAQQRQQNETAARTRLDLLDGCDDVDDASGTPPKFPDCAVVEFGVVASAPPTPAESTLQNAAPTFAALKTYAAALTAVTTAADDTTLNQAAQNLTSSVADLTTAVAKTAPDASAANSSVTAGAGVLGQMMSWYLNSRRLTALRAEVPKADLAIKALGNTALAALLEIRAQQLQQMQKELHAAVMPLQTTVVSKMSATDYHNNLTALEAKVVAFNQTRNANPATVVTAMVDAHHQLAQALLSGSGQSQAVYAAAKSFLAAAAQLKSALSPTTGPGSAASKPAS